MANKPFVEKLKAALERDAQRPTRERWDALVRRGAIDASGKVLVRGPQGNHDEPDPKGGKAKKAGK